MKKTNEIFLQRKQLFLLQLFKLQDIAQINQFLLYMFYIGGLLQCILFVTQTTVITHGFLNTPLNYLSKFIYLIRPDYLIANYQTFNFYTYVFPLVVSFFFEVSPLILLFIFSIKSRCTCFWKIYSFYQQISSIYFHIPFSSLCYLSIKQNLFFGKQSNIEIHYLNSLFSIITLIWLLTSQIFKITMLKQSIDLTFINIKVLKVGFYDILLLIINHTQLAIFYYQEINQCITQSILLLIYIILTMFNIYQMNICNNNQINFQLLIYSYGLLSSILSLLDNYIFSEYNTLYILIVPIMFFIFKQIYNYQEYDWLLNNKNLQIKNIKYRFIKYFNSQLKFDMNTILLYTQILNQYEKKKQRQKIEYYSLPFLTNEAIPQYLINYYLKTQLKQYEKQLSNKKVNDNSDYIHYFAILHKLGLSNVALKQIIALNVKQHSRLSNISITKDTNSQYQKTMNTEGKKSSAILSSQSQNLSLNQKNINIIKFIGNKQQLSETQYIQLILLQEKIRESLKTNFLSKELNKTTSLLQKQVNIYLNNEQLNKELKDEIILAINQKHTFLLQLIQMKHISQNEIFQLSKKLCNQISFLKNKLLKLYQIYQNKRIQSMICFYLSEVTENYIDAYRLAASSSLSDEQLTNNDINNFQQIELQNVGFLSLILSEEKQELEIQNCSPKISHFFQKDYEELKKHNSIQQVLPNFIKNEHQILVWRFISTSESKFYLNKSLTFYKLYDIIVEPFEMLFEIQFQELMNMQFFVFYNQIQRSSSYILVDVNKQVGGITKNLFEKIGLGPFSHDMIELQSFHVNIEYLIPDFQDILHINNQIIETQFIFLNQKAFLSLFKIENEKNNLIDWDNELNLQYYIINLELSPKEIYGFYYYVIEIFEIKQFDHKTDKIYSCYTKTIMENSSNLNTLPQVSGFEAQANSPPAIEFKKSVFIQHQKNNELFEMPRRYPSQDFYLNPEDINIASPQGDLSQNQLCLPSGKTLLSHKQQEYYNQQQEHSNEASISLKLSLCKNKQEHFDNHLQIQVSQQNDETNSSSLTGIRKSLFYKKYEIIEQVIQLKYPNKIKLLILLLLIFFIIDSIEFILIITKNQAELNHFISEVDMIELHSGFMAPSDLFLAMRIGIISYKAYLTAGVITQAESSLLLKPLYANVNIGYQETKEIVIQQLSNQNLEPFFKDKTIEMQVMGISTKDCYNITMTIREAFLTTISNLYKVMLLYQSGVGIAGTSYQVFAVGNQFRFHRWLEILTLEIFYYSKNRCVSIQQSWITQYIIFLVITIIIILISLYYLRAVFKQYDKYVNIFKFCNLIKLQQEIEKQKILIKQITQDSEIIFTFKFDINIKEQELIQIQQMHEITVKKSQDSQRLQLNKHGSLTQLIRMGLIFLLFIIYFTIGVVLFQDQMTYLNKYSATVDIYKLIQDMTYTSAELYMNRDYMFIWGNFSYLDQADKNTIETLIMDGLTNIDKFSILCQNFDASYYQISNDFVNFFNNIQQNSVCDGLGNDVLGFATVYCKISIEGNFDKGILATLHYVKNTIQTQMEINNFTSRVEYPVYDVEAGIIMVRVFQQMTKKLKASMQQVAKDLSSLSFVLSISYLLFSSISICLLITIIQQYLYQEHNQVKLFVQLLPLSVKMLDDQFERYLRLLYIEEK